MLCILTNRICKNFHHHQYQFQHTVHTQHLELHLVDCPHTLQIQTHTDPQVEIEVSVRSNTEKQCTPQKTQPT